MHLLFKKMHRDFHNATTNDKKILILSSKQSQQWIFSNQNEGHWFISIKTDLQFTDDNFDETELKFGGIGYLFDTTSDDLIRQLLLTSCCNLNGR